MKKFFYQMLSKFLTVFGDIKVFKWPLWFVYDPDDYQVTGKDVLKIQSLIEPGDIILRGYNRYLDGKFIPSFKNDKIGSGFSHGAIYLGNNIVIHAIAEGVSKINLIDFLQCDRIAVFRPRKYQATALKKAKKFLKDNTPYDFCFQRDSSALYCFELCVECYPKLIFPAQTIKKFFGLIKKENVFIAQSFVESKDVHLIYCHNPKSGIEYSIV